MSQLTLVVPRGAEAAAVRRTVPACRVLEVPAGAAARQLDAALIPDAPVLVLGLCGALRERRVGDVVLYRSVADERAAIACGPFDDAVLRGTTVHSVAACTTDHVVTTIAERNALAARYDADVVDMEGTHVAATLVARGTPFAMLRVVSDDAQRNLPALDGVIRADGRLAIGRVAGAFARDPRGALAFVLDARRALAVLGTVAAAVSRAAC